MGSRYWARVRLCYEINQTESDSENLSAPGLPATLCKGCDMILIPSLSTTVRDNGKSFQCSLVHQ
jgi:RNase P subunit RPR2